jgi:transcriptional regulator with XRE-family HTH domain
MNSEPLLPQTYRLLDATNLTYRQIAEGCGVDVNWLMKFKQRQIKEPGVTKVQLVHDFLSAYNAIRMSPLAADSPA